MKLKPTACWASWADAIEMIVDKHPELEPLSVLSTRKLKPQRTALLASSPSASPPTLAIIGLRQLLGCWVVVDYH